MSDAPHTVKSYEEELKNLNANIIKMGSACEDSLGKAIQAIGRAGEQRKPRIVMACRRLRVQKIGYSRKCFGC